MADDDLIFLMGKFEARIPTDRLYARNHMWVQPHGAECKCGFSAYAVRLLQDVYFLEWSVDAGARVREKELLGAIESSKAESDLYSPLAGTLTTFNTDLLSDPATINVDKYERGWLFTIETNQISELLEPPAYLEHLKSAWEVAQRTIKKQIE